MKAGPIIGTLLNFLKLHDDFVAPAATRVLCSLLPEGLSVTSIETKICR